MTHTALNKQPDQLQVGEQWKLTWKAW